MEHLPERFMQSARQVRLTNGEKSRMRERLVAHMRAHPITVAPPQSPYQRFLSVRTPFTAWLRTPVLALALFLVITGGALTFAASDSLPGNTLYPIKVSVLEPARGAFALTPQDKADWNVSLTEVRLREVEHLVEKGTFTPSESLKSKERFDRSVRTTRASIEDLSKKNPDAAARVNASFGESLDTHRKKLLEIGGVASTTDDEDVRSFADHIEKESQSSRADKEKGPEESDD